MKKELQAAILNKIENIIYDKDTSVNEKVSIIFDILRKHHNSISFWDKENFLDTENLETIIFEYKKPEARAEEENTKSPFYNIAKDIAKAEYEKFVNNFAEDILKVKKDPFQQAMENLQKNINGYVSDGTSFEIGIDPGKEEGDKTGIFFGKWTLTLTPEGRKHFDDILKLSNKDKANKERFLHGNWKYDDEKTLWEKIKDKFNNLFDF